MKRTTMNMATNQYMMFVLSLITPFLAGCGGGGNSSSNAPVIPTPTVLTASAVASNGLTGTMSQSATTVSVGGNVQYKLTLTNTTDQAVVLHTTYHANQPPGVPVGLEVKDPTGNLIYPSNSIGGDGGGPDRTVDVTLQPGQAISETIPVNGFTTKGLYTARAGFLTGSGPTSIITADVGPLTVLTQ